MIAVAALRSWQRLLVILNFTVVNFPQEKNSVGILESFPDGVNLRKRQVDLSNTNGGL